MQSFLKLNQESEDRGRRQWTPREDKGDREGIPHIHPIPKVIRLELFLRP